MAISIDLKVGEALKIGDTVLRLESKSGQLARLVIDADKSIPVKKVGPSPAMQLIAEQGIMTT